MKLLLVTLLLISTIQLGFASTKEKLSSDEKSISKVEPEQEVIDRDQNNEEKVDDLKADLDDESIDY